MKRPCKSRDIAHRGMKILAPDNLTKLPGVPSGLWKDKYFRMKNILWILAPVLVANNLHAQITLSQSSYPLSVVGADSLKVTTVSSSFPALAATTDGMWDMSGVTDSVPVFFAYRVPASPYQFADSNMYNFAGFSYQGNVQSSITSDGIFEYGINIPRTAYSISILTGGGTDSFIIPAQAMLFTAPRAKIEFPTTYNTSWSSAYQSDLDFQLTYLMEGDTLAPGIVRSYTTEKDSVTGWGKMSIKDASGSPSAFLNVLQVQTMIIHTDSFFLKGIPISGPLLILLNVTQGQQDTIYEQNYYRPGEVTALAQVEFRDAAYTQPYKATTLVQQLQDVSVPGVAGKTDIAIYPNPVTEGVVYIKLPSSGAWDYELVGEDGRKVLAGSLSAQDNLAKIVIPATVIPGVYNLQLNSGGKAISTTLLGIVK